MPQTFKDFICEWEMFDYSKENFDLIKECESLCLMEQLVENHRMISEIGSIDKVVFESTTYTASDVAQIQAIRESVKTKFIEIIDKIKGLFAQLLDKISGFINKRSDKIKSNIQINKMVDALKQDPKKLAEIYDNGGKVGFFDKLKLNFTKPKKKSKAAKAGPITTIKTLLAANAVQQGQKVKIINASAESDTEGEAFTEAAALAEVTALLANYQKFIDGEYAYTVESPTRCPESFADFVDTLTGIVTNLLPTVKRMANGTSTIPEKDNIYKLLDEYMLGSNDRTYYYVNYSKDKLSELHAKVDAAKAEILKFCNDLKETNGENSVIAEFMRYVYGRVAACSAGIISAEAAGAKEISAINKQLATLVSDKPTEK